MNVDQLSDYGVPEELIGQMKQRGFRSLTVIQKAALDSGLTAGKNLIISAPTSSGKTTIAELAAINAAQQGRRTVYLVTHKALAEEKYRYFKNAYDPGGDRWFRVSISTGDRSEGDWNDGILIATYEKFLSLVSNHIVSNYNKLIVVADEIQTVSAESRGADIEILCTILLHAQPSQFIGLTAVTPNARDLADWLSCECCEVKHRDVPLRQEVWYNGHASYCMSGDQEMFSAEKNIPSPINSVAAAKILIENGLGPVLVFCMTKPKAEQLATEYAGISVRKDSSVDVSRQLDMFSEPTSLGQKLREVTTKKVAFHTADLSFSERVVVEQALREGSIDVVFATPTLAAGVNLPIRTVLFDSFNRSWIDPPWLSHSEYTNMAGRAGRLGYHEEGTSVLLPASRTEYGVAYKYVTEQPEQVRSVLMDKSIRKSVLQLVSCAVCNSHQSLLDFFQKTLWYRQALDTNIKITRQLETRLKEAVDWLSENGLFSEKNGEIVSTEFGRAVSATGLLPSTAVSLVSFVREIKAQDVESRVFGLLHLACASDEFSEEIGQRFLPYASKNQASPAAYQTVRKSTLFVDPDTRQNQPRVDNASYLLSLWINGVSESDLMRAVPSVRYGLLQTLSQDVGWIFEGISSVLKSPAVDSDPKLITEIQLLAKRVNFGVTIDAIDILEAAKISEVPGFGRHRAMKLVASDCATPDKLLSVKEDTLATIVDGIDRAKSLLVAVAGLFSKPMEFWRNRHLSIAAEIRADINLIESLYDCDGNSYEDCVLTLLKRMDLSAEKYDDGKKQGVPDIRIFIDAGDVYLECKSREQKKNSPISTDDAFSVLTKANDLNPYHCVTVAKPDIGSHAKKKATSSGAITLISHKTLVQAYLAYFSGKAPKHKIIEWLCQPGIAQDFEL